MNHTAKEIHIVSPGSVFSAQTTSFDSLRNISRGEKLITDRWQHGPVLQYPRNIIKIDRDKMAYNTNVRKSFSLFLKRFVFTYLIAVGLK